ncbi:MAG: hypothetical protein KC441_20750, partial [Anaerolineales bacterium]|nr:hypothetical protein [Anaerolineales bacterium]
MNPAALALIYHDPQGRLFPQWQRLLPKLAGLFAGIAVRGSSTAHRPTLDFLAGQGVLIYQEPGSSANAGPHIGRGRRQALELALSLHQPAVMYCDGDRMLHWAEHYEAELTAVSAHLLAADFTVFGRTPRAFATHPRSQQDTEAIVNELYGRISGRSWDMLAAARGHSRRAAEFIVAHSSDDEISTDVSWPLLLARQHPAWTQRYVATEGMEFETIAQVLPEVAETGGPEAWLAALDADPHEWVKRLDLARVMAAAM